MAYHDKLDRIFSEYIRLRDSDSKGMCKCISCGKMQFWREVDNGHLINRKHMSVRFDERNCHAQCRACNRFDEGNLMEYTVSFIDKYGKNELEKLRVRRHQSKKFAKFEIDELTKHYRKLVKEMKKEKGVE